MKTKIVKLFKAFSEESRLSIVELLIKGENCGCNLLENLNIAQPTLSYHLKWLTEVGLLIPKKDGVKIYHQIDKTQIDRMIEYLQGLKEHTQDCNLA